MAGANEITVRIPARYAGSIASILADGVVQAKVADAEERETYGYGPVITCDSEEVRSNLERNDSACYDVLRQLAEAGDESAKLSLGTSTMYSPGANSPFALESRIERAVTQVRERHAAQRKAEADRKAAETHERRVAAGKKGAAARAASSTTVATAKQTND